MHLLGSSIPFYAEQFLMWSILTAKGFLHRNNSKTSPSLTTEASLSYSLTQHKHMKNIMAYMVFMSHHCPFPCFYSSTTITYPFMKNLSSHQYHMYTITVRYFYIIFQSKLFPICYPHISNFTYPFSCLFHIGTYLP
jgi:hypothetical protein